MKCDADCITCNGPTKNDCLTSLTSCLKIENREIVGAQCVCSSNFFEDSVTLKCLSCSPLCFTCNGDSDNNCLSCHDGNISMRITKGNTCACQDGYFDEFLISGSIICALCDAKCKTCSSFDSCSTCDQGNSF